MGHDFTGADLRAMIAEVREVNTALGWRQGGNTVDDYVALLHSELAEATDAYRRWRFADATGPDQVPENIGSIYHRPLTEHERRTYARPAKPEGVGSEFADLFIRLLDHGDALGQAMNGWTELVHSNVPEPETDRGSYSVRPTMTSFGQQIAWLHHLVDKAYISALVDGLEPGGYSLDTILAWRNIFDELRRACQAFGIDLAAEYRRKIDYNRTREYQHGGRTLNEANGAPPCLCERLDWSTVTDKDRGDDGMNHHPDCPLGNYRPPVSAGPHAAPAGEGAKRRRYAEPGVYNDYP